MVQGLYSMDARSPLPFLQVYREGLLLFRERQWVQAIAAFDCAHAIYCHDPGPMAFKARAILHLQQVAAEKMVKKNEEEMSMAVTRASAGLQGNGPGYAEYLRGMAYYTEGNIPQAKDSFMKAEQAGCQRADLYLHISIIELNQGNEALALHYLEKARLLNDSDIESDIHLQLGVISMMNNEMAFEESNKHFEKVLENTHPNNLFAWLYQGRLNQLHGDKASSDKGQYFARAAECYKQLVTQTQFDMPLHMRLLLAILGDRVQLLLRKNRYPVQNVAQFTDASIDILIGTLKAKEAKSVEEMCILFLAQGWAGKFKDACASFYQLLNVLSDHGENAYAAIPYYLKRDFYAVIVLCSEGKCNALEYTDKTDLLKRVVLDLLRVRETENYGIRLLQINAGLLALSQQSLLGSVLYVKQGMFSSPSLSSGKLAELVEHLTSVLRKMNLHTGASGEAFRLCAATNSTLGACKESLEGYPLIYEAVVGSPPPVRQPWYGSIFSSAAAAGIQQRQPSPLPQSGTIKQVP